MALQLQLCLMVSLSAFIGSHALSRPSNGLRDCRKTITIPALEVLPGGGWDNLRNLDMGRVMNLSYSQCQTTEDGIYLIPDEVFVIPQKMSGLETNSELISSWLDQRSTTSFSINAGASYKQINGKFSVEFQRMKTHQVRETAVTTLVQVRSHMYTVKTFPDFTLDSRFAHQAEEIADAIVNNQTRQAAYLSERLVLDYGTHVITTLEAGASLVQEDYLKASYVADSALFKTAVTVSAGFKFSKEVNFNFGSNLSYETSETRSYEGNVTYSLTQSHGGASFYPGITLQKWQESTLNNLVAIDRAGLPLQYFLSRAAFPNLPEPTVHKLATSVRKAIERYYAVNTRPGCVQQESQNFNFQANVDDGSCEGAATNLSFGGVYQQCTKLTQDADPICDALTQKNPNTGNYTCREPFTPTLLQSQEVAEKYNRKKCSFFVCRNVYYVRRAKIDTYWCSTDTVTQKYSGYIFGGLYGPSLENPLTKSNSCPPSFIPLKLLANGLVVCLSNDYEAGSRFSVPFGGFFSCKSGNPFMNGQSRCPPQFSQHLAAISDGCEVLYCVQSGIFTGGELTPVRLPPFVVAPVTYMPLSYNNVTVVTEGDKAWIRVKGTNMWTLTNANEIEKLHSE
ncbi:macrophage-expressed gene 1 protein-like [Sardina pilchardus]|uniref:macrophage-expressed gene 1 protein-like n=1 Tax=Sardina pilchardus TaxID=27697 RepID=UPI002E15C149